MRVFPNYSFNEEEIKKPRFYRGFFVYKNWLPLLGEPYHSSKPIAGILRSKPRGEHKYSLTYRVNYSDYSNSIFDLYHEIIKILLFLFLPDQDEEPYKGNTPSNRGCKPHRFLKKKPGHNRS